MTAVTGFVFYNGITFKLGEKSIDIGGLKKTFVNNRADVFTKERLKKQIDEVDEEMIADPFDLIDLMSARFEQILIDNHCRFTPDKFVGLIKKELIRRVRRNNLKVKLCGVNEGWVQDR